MVARAVAPRHPSAGEAVAFIAAIHAMQRREGLWLAQHRFVLAVRNGSATRNQLEQWVRLQYCNAKVLGEILLSINPPPSVGVWIDPWCDIEWLLQLGAALGISPAQLTTSEPNRAARGLQLWLRSHLANPTCHVAAQVSWALAEAMAPEAGRYLAAGAAKHFGLHAAQLGYFQIAMQSRRRADKYAATIIRQVPEAGWPWIQAQAMLVTRLRVELYGGA